jgi:hypothetical protein
VPEVRFGSRAHLTAKQVFDFSHFTHVATTLQSPKVRPIQLHKAAPRISAGGRQKWQLIRMLAGLVFLRPSRHSEASRGQTPVFRSGLVQIQVSVLQLFCRNWAYLKCLFPPNW